MIYLFVHQNFPGQYKHLARALADDPSNQVFFITRANQNWMQGVEKLVYAAPTAPVGQCHPYVVEMHHAAHAGDAVAAECMKLRERGIVPDIVIGHAGWGETLFIRNVFPGVPILANFEFYYRAQDSDVDFDPEFASVFNSADRLHMRNAVSLLAFESATHGHSATRWQHELHPAHMRSGITVLHEGVDTRRVRPDPNAVLELPERGLSLSPDDEIVTFVARNLEPYRGFHVFMRALPALLKKRRKAHVLIVGGNGVSYGSPSAPGTTWRECLLAELGDRLDTDRVHFLGQVEYEQYIRILQVSSAHVYLTYPFVLSWSFLEAMSAGCIVVGSGTAPVLEVLKPDVNGFAVDFLSPEALSSCLAAVLGNRRRLSRIRAEARATAVRQFDLETVILPRWHALIARLVGKPAQGLAA